MKKDRPYHSIRKPHFLGDKKEFQKFLAANLVFPKEALENKIEGTALVKCEISDKGKVLKVESMHKLGYGLDEEAERLCLLLKFDDTTERGLKIRHSKTIRIPFKLPKPPPLKINYTTTTTTTTPAPEKKGGYTYTIKF